MLIIQNQIFFVKWLTYLQCVCGGWGVSVCVGVGWWVGGDWRVARNETWGKTNEKKDIKKYKNALNILWVSLAYNSMLELNLQYLINRHYIWPHSRKMYPKFTCSCRVEIFIGNKHVFCSDVYNSPPIQILLSKHSIVHRFNNRNTKTISRDFSKVLHACMFYSAGSNVCLNNK